MSTKRSVSPQLQPAGRQTQLPLAAIIGPFGRAIAIIIRSIEPAPVWEASSAYKGGTIAYAAARDRGGNTRGHPYSERYYERGLAYLEMGKYEKAVLDFRRVLAISEHAGANCSLALIYKVQGKLIEALSEIDRAVAISPDTGVFYGIRAGIYLDLGGVEEAVADLAAFHCKAREAGGDRQVG
jgi:Tfp pilus assembly protein PilF